MVQKCVVGLLIGFLLICLLVITVSIFVHSHIESQEKNKMLNSTWEKEATSIQTFRTLINTTELYEQYMQDDSYLIRWIKDSDFNLEKAAANLRKNLKWRIENKIDSILAENYTDIYNLCPYTANVRDKDGNIIVFVPIRFWKLRKATLTGNMPRMKRTIFQIMEKIAIELRVLRKFGKDVGVVGVLDLMGLSLVEHGCVNCISAISTIITTHEEYYPGYIKAWNLINVSRLAEGFINLFLPLLSPSSKKIMKIYGYNDKEVWRNELMKTIDLDQLPLKSGRNRTLAYLGVNGTLMTTQDHQKYIDGSKQGTSFGVPTLNHQYELWESNYRKTVVGHLGKIYLGKTTLPTFQLPTLQKGSITNSTGLWVLSGLLCGDFATLSEGSNEIPKILYIIIKRQCKKYCRRYKNLTFMKWITKIATCVPDF